MPTLTTTAVPDGTLRLSGTLQIYDVEPARQAMRDHLAQQEEFHLDLTDLADCDTAGLQLLLAAHRSALAAGKRFSVQGLGPTLASRATALGLAPDHFSSTTS